MSEHQMCADLIGLRSLTLLTLNYSSQGFIIMQTKCIKIATFLYPKRKYLQWLLSFVIHVYNADHPFAWGGVFLWMRLQTPLARASCPFSMAFLINIITSTFLYFALLCILFLWTSCDLSTILIFTLNKYNNYIICILC